MRAAPKKRFVALERDNGSSNDLQRMLMAPRPPCGGPMRALFLAVLLVVGVPGTAAALPVPPETIPDGYVPLLHCGYAQTWTQHWEPEPYDPRKPYPPPPPPDQQRWKNVTVRFDPDACVAPLAERCDDLGVPCCRVVPGAEPCRPSTVMYGVPGTRGQQGIALPMGGGVCLTYALPTDAWVETHNCWEEPTQGGR